MLIKSKSESELLYSVFAAPQETVCGLRDQEVVLNSRLRRIKQPPFGDESSPVGESRGRMICTRDASATDWHCIIASTSGTQTFFFFLEPPHCPLLMQRLLSMDK